MILREYQTDCLRAIAQRGPGRWLVQMATGLGKTVTFANLPRPGRLLILSHREELVRQPVKYFNCKVGIEQAKNRANGEPVVSASVASLVRRLDNFAPDYFDAVVIDEAHHAAAKTYRKIIDHFKPRTLLGFTATPNRSDGAGLDDIFDAVIYEYPLLPAIQDGWLAPIECRRVDIGYDLRDVRTRMGDFNQIELSEAVNISSANKAVSEAIDKYATGPTLVFAVDVDHTLALAQAIGGVAIHGGTKHRDEILSGFLDGKIDRLVNCMVLTEGTDLPNIETVVWVRPTQSVTLYTQGVGRGTRLFDGKKKMTLIDCVGASRHDLCSAAMLAGVDVCAIPPDELQNLEGDIFDLPEVAEPLIDGPKAWIRNSQVVDLWAKKNRLSLRKINWSKLADGRLRVSLPGRWIELSPPDLTNKVVIRTSAGGASGRLTVQAAIDRVFNTLDQHASDERILWDRSVSRRWRNKPPTDKQIKFISRKHDYSPQTRGDACEIINRMAIK